MTRFWATIALTVISLVFTAMTYRVTRRLRRVRKELRKIARARLLSTPHVEHDDEHHTAWGIGA